MVNHGMNIDIRHIMLLADLMTFKVWRRIPHHASSTLTQISTDNVLHTAYHKHCYVILAAFKWLLTAKPTQSYDLETYDGINDQDKKDNGLSSFLLNTVCHI